VDAWTLSTPAGGKAPSAPSHNRRSHTQWAIYCSTRDRMPGWTMSTCPPRLVPFQEWRQCADQTQTEPRLAISRNVPGPTVRVRDCCQCGQFREGLAECPARRGARRTGSSSAALARASARRRDGPATGGRTLDRTSGWRRASTSKKHAPDLIPAGALLTPVSRARAGEGRYPARPKPSPEADLIWHSRHLLHG